MSEDRQERFAAYVEALAEVIGHADRAEPLRDYCRGLLLPGERKSVEPIAAVTAPARVSAKHQSLLHFVANAPWSDERVLGRIQELSVPLIEGSGAIEAWIIDDTADSGDVGPSFRLMSATCSDRSRPAIPTDVGRGGGAP